MKKIKTAGQSSAHQNRQIKAKCKSESATLKSHNDFIGRLKQSASELVYSDAAFVEKLMTKLKSDKTAVKLELKKLEILAEEMAEKIKAGSFDEAFAILKNKVDALKKKLLRAFDRRKM